MLFALCHLYQYRGDKELELIRVSGAERDTSLFRRRDMDYLKQNSR